MVQIDVQIKVQIKVQIPFGVVQEVVQTAWSGANIVQIAPGVVQTARGVGVRFMGCGS